MRIRRIMLSITSLFSGRLTSIATGPSARRWVHALDYPFGNCGFRRAGPYIIGRPADEAVQIPFSNADPEISQLRQAAAEALKKGRFAEADGYLAAAEARDLAGLEDIEALAKVKRLSAAESRSERAAVAMLRTNSDAYAEAATHYAEAARIAAKADATVARDYSRRQGETLIALGNEFGRNSSLLEAIEHFRKMSASSCRSDAPLDWATTQTSLGTALWRLGERESGTARLEEAVSSYRAALEERTRERVPLDWAMTQNNLGTALCSLGARESGTARFEEAVSAYRAALEEYTRERVPLQWAATQKNLDQATALLAQRQKK
jgi:Tetratricopeptide repeat